MAQADIIDQPLISDGSSLTRLFWNDLTCETTAARFSFKNGSVPKFVRRRRHILKPQSGVITAGTITAVIGPAYGNKQMLLDCISRKATKGVSGEISAVNQNHRHTLTTVIKEDNKLIECFTVRQTLNYALDLIPANNIYDKEFELTRILNILDLKAVADKRIAHCNHVQKLCVTIGCELFTRPQVLILHEPDKHLNSFEATRLMEILRYLTDSVDNAPAILLTVNHFSSSCLRQVHNLYLLSRDGRCVYFGPHDGIVQHVARFDLKIPNYSNPFEFAVEVRRSLSVT